MNNKEQEALDKLNKFVEKNNIQLKVSVPYLVQGENGLKFGDQNIIVVLKPEPSKEEPIVEGEVLQPD